MPGFSSTAEKLERAHHDFLRAANSISPDLWRTAPSHGAWSAAEVVAHIAVIESTVIAAAARILQKQPKHIPLLKRFSVPPAVVERRVVRLKSPIPIDPQLLGPRETMLAQLSEVRARTLALLNANKDRDLRAYRWKHPFLGMLDAYSWFSFLASHQIRHEKQLREIASSLRNPVASSQK